VAVSWFICFMVRVEPGPTGRPRRDCALRPFSAQIRGAGGDWKYTEVLGGYAVCKVRASAELLATIGGTPNVLRLNLDRLDRRLSELPSNVRTAIRNRLEQMGYSVAEISGRFPGAIGQYTVGEALRFAAQRRLTPRWDDVQQQIVLDGAYVACTSVDAIDAAVSNA
jgi:hypothetical protein